MGLDKYNTLTVFRLRKKIYQFVFNLRQLQKKIMFLELNSEL